MYIFPTYFFLYINCIEPKYLVPRPQKVFKFVGDVRVYVQRNVHRPPLSTK